jgi:hypothetical protein
LGKILDDVKSKVEEHPEKRRRSFVLPHCTWDKFGDILANNGGKVIGLFDEFVSFFSTMNMYSASKTQVQDNREYQDFLQMFTGKAKNRETGIYIIKQNRIVYTDQYRRSLVYAQAGLKNNTLP